MLETILTITCNGLHMTATVLLVGYYLLLAAVFLPVLERAQGGPYLPATLGEIHRRARPLILGSILAFLATGIVMLLTNEAYMGLGDFFANAWSVLMTAKHLLVAVLITMAFSIDASFRRPAAHPSDPGALPAGFRGKVDAAAIAGVGVLLLTAVCQGL
jgi:hypothetical protein